MNIKLGKALLKLRKEANLSQKEVSGIASCSRGTYSCWERDEGEIPLSKLLAILTYCQITLQTFIKMAKEEDPRITSVLQEPEWTDIVDIKMELAFISKRLTQLNQRLMI